MNPYSSARYEHDTGSEDGAIEAFRADDQAMADVYGDLAGNLCGDDVYTISEAYSALKRITDGCCVDDLSCGQMGALVALWRMVKRMAENVSDEVSRRALA